MNTKLLQPTPEHVSLAASALHAGSVIAIPTETVYGLAAHAFDIDAVAQIFAVKERPSFDPLIVHLQDRLWRLESLAHDEFIDLFTIPFELRPVLNTLMEHFWPGPLTLVLPRHARIPDLVTAGLPTVALRVPRHPVAQALLKHNLALAAPSANRFGRISPTSTDDVLAELGGRIPYILDGGNCAIGLESTVIGLQGEHLSLLRPGGLSPEEIEQKIDRILIRPEHHPVDIRAPGMLDSHYAPGHALQLFSDRKQLFELLEQSIQESQRPGLLLLSPPDKVLEDLLKRNAIRYHCLSASGQANEIAQNLFSGLRYLDQDTLSYILAELPLNGMGLVHAIRDRLFKAAGRSER